MNSATPDATTWHGSGCGGVEWGWEVRVGVGGRSGGTPTSAGDDVQGLPKLREDSSEKKTKTNNQRKGRTLEVLIVSYASKLFKMQIYYKNSVLKSVWLNIENHMWKKCPVEI